MPQEQNNPPSTGSHQDRRLIETAAAAGAERDEHNGRQVAPRLASGILLDATTDPHTPSCAWPVIMHNVSDGGFAFWSKRQLRTGSDVWVREFRSDESADWLRAVVTRCTVGIKGFLIGAAFVATHEASNAPSGSTRERPGE
jgi:hypothetical protein